MTHTSETTPRSGKTNIVFFGTESFSLLALTQLVQAGYDIAAVVTKPDTKKGRGHALQAPQVKTYALEHDIPVWQPEKLSDVAPDIAALAPVAGVLVSYGKIIPESIIALFTPGIINVHPSLLPAYRGPTPIESAIANGDQETGVTIMQLTRGMDAGPLYAFSPLELTGTETQPELYQTLGELGAQMLVAILPDILAGAMHPYPQNDELATYCQLLRKSDAYIDTGNHTAVEIERLIRAHLTFPKTKLLIHGTERIVTKAHVTTKQRTPLDVHCADDTILAIDELVAPSGKTLSADAFLRGYSAS